MWDKIIKAKYLHLQLFLLQFVFSNVLIEFSANTKGCFN